MAEDKSEQRRLAGLALMQRGLLVAARDEFDRWLTEVEPSGDPTLIVPALNALATIAHVRGDHEGALAYLNAARPLVLDVEPTSVHRLKVYTNLMKMYVDTMRLEDALVAADEAADSGADSHPQTGAHYWLNLSMLHWRRHEWVPMLKAAREAAERAHSMGHVAYKARALTNSAIAHLELGAFRLAERSLNQVLTLEQLDASEMAYAHAELGRLHFEMGDYRAALGSGRQALKTLLSTEEPLDKEEVARVSRLFGSIFAVWGQRNLALKYLNRAAAYFSQLGIRNEWQRCTEAIGEVLSRPSRPVPGQTLHDELSRLAFLTAMLDLTDDLESVDPYLRGHSERVANLCVVIGQEHGITGEELLILNHAARLHDVGKVTVDAELLQREDKLSDAELRRVRMHAIIGEEMVRAYGLAPAGLAAIRHQQECFDGTGLPDGLAGEGVPLMARIIALADVYDALTSDRPYRQAMCHSTAMDEIRAMAGTKLDPALVSLFVRMHEV